MGHKNEIPSQTVATVKPVPVNLQTRPFATPEVQEEEVSQEQDKSRSGNLNFSENLLEKQISMPISESATPVQKKSENRLKAIGTQKIAVQTKLNIGEPNDKYEQEADNTAVKVVQQITSLVSPPINLSANLPVQNQSVQNQPVQRQEVKEEESKKERKEVNKLSTNPQPPPVQRKEISRNRLKRKSLVQRRENIGGGEVSTDLESSIQNARGGGQSLDTGLQAKMGQAMGADFSRVKVHTDSQSDQLNKSIQAKAFTTGQDVFFRQGTYDPSSQGGQELIAHELTHVVQQNSGAVQRLVQREVYLDQRGVDAHYDLERTVQRGDLRGVVESYGTFVSKLYSMIEALKLVAVGDASGLNTVKAMLDLGDDAQQSVHGAIAAMDRDTTMHTLNHFYSTQLEKAQLQDIVINAKGELDMAALAARLVEYDDTSAAQDKTLVSFSGGKLKRSATHDTPSADVDTSASVTQHTGKGWEIFVMSPTGALHMASHKIGKYHHSSLLAGGATSAAGTIKATGGTIEKLNNKSGHYRPGEAQMRQALHQLQKVGVSLNFDLDIAGKYSGKAEDYMKPVSAGGQGGLDTFEFGSAQRILHHFINTKGEAAVRKAFTDLNWVYVSASTGIIITKDDGTTPNHEEVRNVLTTHFAESGPVNVTRT